MVNARDGLHNVSPGCKGRATLKTHAHPVNQVQSCEPIHRSSSASLLLAITGCFSIHGWTTKLTSLDIINRLAIADPLLSIVIARRLDCVGSDEL